MNPVFKRIVYVGTHDNKTELWWVSDEGTQEYPSIFASRPSWARFVVLDDGHEILNVDMFLTEIEIHSHGVSVVMPEALRFPTIDAAIMAAQMKL